MKTQAELATDAADYIETYGWLQNDYFDATQIPRDYFDGNRSYPSLQTVVSSLHLRMCISGVLFGVTDTGAPYPDRLLMSVQSFLREKTGQPQNIVAWNDEYGRTKEEVIQLLRDYAEARS